jgi:hypothetical protein
LQIKVKKKNKNKNPNNPLGGVRQHDITQNLKSQIFNLRSLNLNKQNVMSKAYGSSDNFNFRLFKENLN